MVQMDGLEVIEVLAVLKSPPVRRLRLLVLWISEPSVFDGLEVSLFYCTCFVFRFPMIVLPLFWSMTFSWLHLLLWCMVDLIWCQFDSWSFLFVQARTRDMLHMSIRLFLLWNITSTMGIELFWMFRLVCTKQCCPFLWLDASMLRWKTFLFPIVDDGIGAISILQLVKLMSDIFCHPLLVLVDGVLWQLHELGDGLETSPSLSQHCSRCSFPQLPQHGCYHLRAFPASVSWSFPNHPAAAVAAAAADSRYFWKFILGAGLGAESRWFEVVSITLSIQSGATVL